MNEKIKYKSKDNYFNITEEKINEEIIVIHYFKNIGFYKNKFFYTKSKYNMNGFLIEYSNKDGVVINYRNNPIKQTTYPELFCSKKDI